jgi:predicted P-loop ATPase
MSSKRPMVIIGTSGSHDYLRDPNGEKRFWPVHVDASNGRDLSPAEQRALARLLGRDPTKMEY